jgi:hypothetical protein
VTSSEHVARELARIAKCPFEEAQETYEHELEVLKADARVTTFIEALATRRALDVLGRRH